MSYRCVVLGAGTQTAAQGLEPMLNAWARENGYVLEPGTLNLCSQRGPELPESFVNLEAVKHLAPRQGATLDPRLYPVLLDGSRTAWLFRWSDPQHLDAWVSDADGCPRVCRWEIVAEDHLKTSLDLEVGDVVEVDFVSGDVR